VCMCTAFHCIVLLTANFSAAAVTETVLDSCGEIIPEPLLLLCSFSVFFF